MTRRLSIVFTVGALTVLTGVAAARDRAVLPSASVRVEAGFGFTMTVGSNVFNAPPALTSITYSVSGAPPGVTVTPTSATAFAPSFPPLNFAVATDASTIPGRYLLVIAGQANGAPGFSVALQHFAFEVLPAQFNAPIVTPATITLAAGGTATFTALTNVKTHYPSTITITPMAPPNITITPPSVVLSPSNLTTPFAVFQVKSTVPGTTTVPVEFRSSSGQQETVPLTVSVTGLPATTDFTMAVSPAVISLSAGETRQVTVTINPVSAPFLSNGALGQLPPAADVVVTVVAANGVTIAPSQFTVTPPATRTLSVTVSPQSSGIIPVTITGVSGANRHVARVDIPILPAITAIVPGSVVAPSTSQTVRLAGTNFAPGGVVISRSPGVIVESTTVFSPTLAEAVISVQPGAPIGALRLDFRNPEGAISVRGATLFVYPQEAIGAPLGVSTAAIIFPVEGTIVSNGQNVYPRGLLATSGTGIVTGHWAIDGTAFDHFNATTSAGEPLKIRARVPIPPTAIGRHEISLVIESPRLTRAPVVAIETSAVSLPPITIYEPLDRAIIEGQPRIRWSLVPGASSYDLELRQMTAEHRDRVPRRVHTTDSEWVPKDLAAGTYSIRVRPIYPIDVRGEPTPWITATILPANVALRIDGASDRSVTWSGGVPGMLYRVEFLGSGGRCFDALTFASAYALPVSMPWRNCESVRVRAFAPSGTVVGTSDVRRLPPSFANGVALARVVTPAEVVERFPVLHAASPIGARWSGAPGGDVSLIVDGVDVTAVSVRERQAIAYNALLPLHGGTHVAALVSGGRTEEWTFDVADDPPAAAAPAAPAAKYVLEPGGSILWLRKDTGKESAEEHLTLGSEGETGDAVKATGAKGKGDLAWVGTSDPNRIVQESRSIRFDDRIGTQNFGLASLGYFTPTFTDGTDYLQTGVARTGVAVSGGTKYGTLSYYQPFDPSVHGVLSADPQNLKIRNVAFASPENPRYTVRAIGLQVDEPSDLLHATPGSATRTFGILAGYTFSPAAAVIVEAARGTTDSASGDHRGSAARIGVTGKIANADYVLNLRDVTPFFVNPANRGLTSSIADRQGADFNISRAFGKSTLAFTAAGQEQGRSSDSRLPRASASSAGLTLSTTLKPWLTLASTASASHDSGDATASSVPRTDRMQNGASATLGETFAKLSLSQKIEWSRLDNRIDPTANTQITGLTITGAGDVVARISLNTSANYTRTRATPLLGTSTDWFVQLAPTISLSMLKVTPAILINAKSNDVVHSSTHTESYSTIMQWSPPWLASLLTGELYGAMTRSSDNAAAVKQTTTRQARASVTLHLKKSRGLPMFAAPPS